jgi:hypothetical protein
MPLFDKLATILGSNLGDTVAKVVGVFKLSPEQAAEHAAELAKIQADLTAKTVDAATAEMNASAEVIKAEAQSQSWLPRNVRPLLLLLWGLAITLNSIVPIFVRVWMPEFQVVALDPWVYKLTAIGFTGYVTARTWEKVTNSDQ